MLTLNDSSESVITIPVEMEIYPCWKKKELRTKKERTYTLAM